MNKLVFSPLLGAPVSCVDAVILYDVSCRVLSFRVPIFQCPLRLTPTRIGIQSMQMEDIATGWEIATVGILTSLQQHRQRGTSIPLAVGSRALVEVRRAPRAACLSLDPAIPGGDSGSHGCY